MPGFGGLASKDASSLIYHGPQNPQRKAPELASLAVVPETYLGGNRETLHGALNLVEFLRLALDLEKQMGS